MTFYYVKKQNTHKFKLFPPRLRKTNFEGKEEILFPSVLIFLIYVEII